MFHHHGLVVTCPSGKSLASQATLGFSVLLIYCSYSLEPVGYGRYRQIIKSYVVVMPPLRDISLVWHTLCPRGPGRAWVLPWSSPIPPPLSLSPISPFPTLSSSSGGSFSRGFPLGSGPECLCVIVVFGLDGVSSFRPMYWEVAGLASSVRQVSGAYPEVGG